MNNSSQFCLSSQTSEGETPRPDGVCATGEGLNVRSQNLHDNDVSGVRPSEGPPVSDAGRQAVFIKLRQNLNVGTWNVRGLSVGKLNEVERELKSRSIDVMGISEVHWTGKRSFYNF